MQLKETGSFPFISYVWEEQRVSSICFKGAVSTILAGSYIATHSNKSKNNAGSDNNNINVKLSVQ